MSCLKRLTIKESFIKILSTNSAALSKRLTA